MQVHLCIYLQLVNINHNKKLDPKQKSIQAWNIDAHLRVQKY